ncbi:MAG TPA: DUF4112 domain-containing protein [Terriglobia bacterium]|nr:DUF4112 domain-containing protein [Terriglobia bacterium]
MNEKSRRPFDDPLAEHLAWLMDSSIGIGPISIGLDGLIGLIPGLGDVVTSIVSALIVLRALQRGVHHAAIIRMLLNIGIDTLLGSVPIVGDAFDFAYKSNIRNLEIYKQSLSGDRKPLKDWGFIILVVLILLAMIILPILGLIYLGHAITSWLR